MQSDFQLNCTSVKLEQSGPQIWFVSGSVGLNHPLGEGRVAQIPAERGKGHHWNRELGGSVPISGHGRLPTHSLPARSTSCSLVLTCFSFSAASSCAGEEALEEEVDLLSLIFGGKVHETSLCSL